MTNSMKLTCEELRNATAEERNEVIVPSLKAAKKHTMRLYSIYRATMAVGILVVAALAFIFVVQLRLGTVKSLLAISPVVALFAFSIYRAEGHAKVWTYVVNSVQSGKFLVKEVKTSRDDVYGLVTYVRHPNTARLAIQAFAGGVIEDEDTLFSEKYEALSVALRSYHAGQVVEIDLPT